MPPKMYVTHYVLMSSIQVESEQYHVGQANTKNILFSFAQMIAHHTVGGCPMRAGDLIATGTLSGPSSTELGCLLELTRDGTVPFEPERKDLNSNKAGFSRQWLEDRDNVVFKAGVFGKGEAPRIGFGTCEGKILPCE